MFRPCTCETGSYVHIGNGGIGLDVVDVMVLSVLVSWSCSCVIDGVYNPTTTITLKDVDYHPDYEYIEGSFIGSAHMYPNGKQIDYNFFYKYKNTHIGNMISARRVQGTIYLH